MVLLGLRTITVPTIAVVASALLPGCALLSSSDTSTVTPLPCHQAGDAVDLGAHALDTMPTAFVVLSGGRYQLTATGFRHDKPFDSPTGRTNVVWGARGTTPTYEPGPATVSGAHASVSVVEGSPTVLDLEGGAWWFLNSNFVQLTLTPCDGATAELLDQR